MSHQADILLLNFNVVATDLCLEDRAVNGEEDPCWQYSVFSELFSSDPKLASLNQINKNSVETLPRPP